MKRDMDLVRDLLLYFEAKTEVPGINSEDTNSGDTILVSRSADTCRDHRQTPAHLNRATAD
jgi:hypothetical protein